MTFIEAKQQLHMAFKVAGVEPILYATLITEEFEMMDKQESITVNDLNHLMAIILSRVALVSKKKRKAATNALIGFGVKLLMMSLEQKITKEVT